MQVELTSNAARFIQRKLADGRFSSANEVVEQAIQFFEAHEPTVQSLKAMIQTGLDDEAAGHVAPLDMDRVREEVRSRAATQ